MRERCRPWNTMQMLTSFSFFFFFFEFSPAGVRIEIAFIEGVNTMVKSELSECMSYTNNDDDGESIITNNNLENKCT